MKMKHPVGVGTQFTFEKRIAHEQRITKIADALKQLQIEAAENGCRKLRRYIEVARTEALRKALAVEIDCQRP